MNSPQEILRDAIERRKPVRFRYNNPNKPGDPKAYHVGLPHAVYATSTGNINLDLYQTDGPILSGALELPAWRDYALSYMSHVEIQENEESFDEAPGYKSYARKYERKFVKI